MGADKYLLGKNVSEIKVGQSGADVFEIDGENILKHVVRKNLKPDLFETYSREALFYQRKMNDAPAYLPKIIDVEISDDELIIMMKKYEHPDRSDINESLLVKLARVLACVHTDVRPEFMKDDAKCAEPMEDQRIEYCLKGWKSVLAEHPGAFGDEAVQKISAKINEIIKWHDAEERVMTHGDFHWDNLLKDENDDILICDWQGVGIGGASGDLSFFLSRLGADGISIDERLFINAYAEAIKEMTGAVVDAGNITRHMAAANVITSFSFWHEFLHGNEEDRVRGIYDKMTEDFRIWEMK